MCVCVQSILAQQRIVSSFNHFVRAFMANAARTATIMLSDVLSSVARKRLIKTYTRTRTAHGEDACTPGSRAVGAGNVNGTTNGSGFLWEKIILTANCKRFRFSPVPFDSHAQRLSNATQPVRQPVARPPIKYPRMNMSSTNGLTKCTDRSPAGRLRRSPKGTMPPTPGLMFV